MNKVLISGLAGLISVGLMGCSSLPELPNTWTLNTTTKSQNYSYCASESCPPITKLTNQVYEPLEPDEPIIVTTAVAEPIKITNTKRSKPKLRKHKKRHVRRKKSLSQPKQCIQWS